MEEWTVKGKETETKWRGFVKGEKLAKSINMSPVSIHRNLYIALWPVTRNLSTMIIPSAKNHGEWPDMHPRSRLDRISTVPRSCSAFGGTSSVWCIMSCRNWVKPLQRIGIERNWCVWAEHWRRNGHSTKRDATKLSPSMTMHGHMSQDRSGLTWKRWNRRSCPTRRILQMLLLRSIIYLSLCYRNV